MHVISPFITECLVDSVVTITALDLRVKNMLDPIYVHIRRRMPRCLWSLLELLLTMKSRLVSGVYRVLVLIAWLGGMEKLLRVEIVTYLNHDKNIMVMQYNIL